MIFDVGANDGRTVETLQRYLPSPRIYAFEPVSATFRELEARTARFPNVSVYPYAMGDAPGSAEIHLRDRATHHSLIPAQDGGGRTETVAVRTIDDVMRELGVDFVHFLKIDTEGFELQVLRGADAALREARIGIVQAEFHLAAGEGLQRLHDALTPHGYELVGLYNQSHGAAPFAKPWPHAEQAGYAPHRLAYADAVYLYTGRAREPGLRPLF